MSWTWLHHIHGWMDQHSAMNMAFPHSRHSCSCMNQVMIESDTWIHDWTAMFMKVEIFMYSTSLLVAAYSLLPKCQIQILSSPSVQILHICTVCECVTCDQLFSCDIMYRPAVLAPFVPPESDPSFSPVLIVWWFVFVVLVWVSHEVWDLWLSAWSCLLLFEVPFLEEGF